MNKGLRYYMNTMLYFRNLLLLGLLGLTTAVAAPPNWLDAVRDDEPAAWWRFQDETLDTVGKVDDAPGPTKNDFATLPTKNQGIRLDGQGTYVRVADAPKFRFDNGDAITIEAWIRPTTVVSNAYIIGKGRTADADNQNWALRIRSMNGDHRLSFLFRTRGKDGKFHRWNSDLSIPKDRSWHHVAFTYRFGQPDTIKAYIDGRASGGSWDLGESPERAPVVDDAEVWIGSARGGDPSNSFHGDLDEIVVHRKLIPPAVLLARVPPAPQTPAVDWSAVTDGSVALELYPGLATPEKWPQHYRKHEVERYELPAAALVALPGVHVDSGARGTRSITYARLYTAVNLPKGRHTFMLRAPGLARVTIDGQQVAAAKYRKIRTDGHNKMRPQAKTPTSYPRARLGTYDLPFSFVSKGGPTRILLESILGYKKARFTVGEVLLAKQSREGNWHLLTSGETAMPFNPAAFQQYSDQQRATFAAVAADDRQRIRKANDASWQQRHRDATTYVRAQPQVQVPALPQGFRATNPIDNFLSIKIHAAQQKEAEKHPHAALARRAIGILDSQCFRCHGKKDKGDLRLDTRRAVLAAGESGKPAVVPGKPDESAIMYHVLTSDEDERMPPKGDGLTDDEIKTLKAWITAGAPWADRNRGVDVPPTTEETVFLRRLYLDNVGILPTSDQIAAYLTDTSIDKKAKLIDQLLASPRHADHWTSYWQDVLAENPRLVKGKLNNTGPFRWWIHDALIDKLPFDRFVTELLAFDGDIFGGGAGGFKIATENDSPMAAKAHIVGSAFLGVEMKCARCHDAPYHKSTQEDLFSLAAMLANKPLKLPASSTIPASFFSKTADRKALVVVNLKPGATIQPKWSLTDFTAPDSAMRGSNWLQRHVGQRQRHVGAREKLAWELTRPDNKRFAQVIVNRIWKGYFGQGFVEPADDWEGNDPSHPELLDYLAQEFVANGYSLDYLTRLILNSDAYVRRARAVPATTEGNRYFEAPMKRRISAEQLIDSLFTATGVPIYSEELTFDVPGWRAANAFTNLGVPTRAWQFLPLTSDRDRPSLTLPYADSIVAVMEAFGWRTDRSQPLTERPDGPSVLQPGMLGNGVFGLWMTRLSPYSELSTLAANAKSPEALTDELYLRFLTRHPTASEKHAFVELLSPGFDSRLTQDSPFRKVAYPTPVREVSWDSHLTAAANVFCAEIEKQALLGPPASDHFDANWRERMEDAVWSLINSPEMVFIP